MKSRLFRMAHAIKANFKTFSEALKHAWKVIKLQWDLCTGEVRFKYKKIDGSIREALGTRDNVPATKGSERAANYGVLTYFDLGVGEWRSAKIENLLF